MLATARKLVYHVNSAARAAECDESEDNQMDIQKIISDVLAKLQGDDNLLAKFKANPTKTIEGLIGIDLPDEQIDAVVKGVLAKINIDDVAEKATGIIGALKGLFGKK